MTGFHPSGVFPEAAVVDRLKVDARLFEEGFGLVSGKRSREQVALSGVATHLSKLFELIFRLDALGCYAESKVVSQIDDRLDDLRGAPIGLHALNEAAIDIKAVEIEGVQVAQ